MRRQPACAFAILAAFVALSCGGGAKQQRVEDAPPKPAGDQTLALDPAVRTGKLKNGLTYYLKRHEKPSKRAYLWLAVDAGSLLEDDDQLGLAHFVEHMAFNGTRRFAKQQIVDFMERAGMSFGPHLNASTDFEHTIYKLQLPTDDPKLLDTGFEILRDWADGLAFEDVEIEKERGVVIEELRRGLGPQQRILDKLLDKLVGDSRYAKRRVIGTKDSLQNAMPDALRRYYRDWYRPELMAVVAVGDFDPLALEIQIQNTFGDLAGPKEPRPRTRYEVPDFEGTRFAIEQDPELPLSVVAIGNKLPGKQVKTRADYRRKLAESLFEAMLNARLEEVRKKGDAPFQGAFAGTAGLSPKASIFAGGAVVRRGEALRGLDALATEIERVNRHGFTRTELERAKAELFRGYKRSVAEKDRVDGRAYVDALLEYHFDGEAMPGAEAGLLLAEALVPDIALDELNGLARQWGGNNNRFIVAVGPKDSGLPDEAKLLATLEAVRGKNITAYNDNAPTGPILAKDKQPVPGSITGRSENNKLGVTEWTLSNGARVVLKPTRFKNDQVLFQAVSPGGTSLVSDAEFRTADLAGAIVLSGGLGSMTSVELDKALSGKSAGYTGGIAELTEGISASGSPRDLETMFQLVYMAFVQPRKDPEWFASWRATQKEQIATRLTSPSEQFDDAFYKTLFSDHPRRRPMTEKLLDAITLDRAYELYRERFADAGDFTFVLVGAFELLDIEPLVTRYLASLPSTGSKETWKDVGVRRAKGLEKVTMRKGIADKSSVRIVFPGKAKWSPFAAHDARSLADVLRIRLREQMREEMGGVYGVGVSGFVVRDPTARSSFRVEFTCAPENVDALVKAVFDEIASIKKSGVKAEYLEKVREAQTRADETSLESNNYWRAQLSLAYVMGDDPEWIIKNAELVETVTSKRMKAAARNYIDTRRYVLGVLYPEKTK